MKNLMMTSLCLLVFVCSSHAQRLPAYSLRDYTYRNAVTARIRVLQQERRMIGKLNQELLREMLLNDGITAPRKKRKLRLLKKLYYRK